MSINSIVFELIVTVCLFYYFHILFGIFIFIIILHVCYAFVILTDAFS